MTSGRRFANSGQAGFTLIETLAAVALMGVIMSVLAVITSQWLRTWDHGFDRIQRNEFVSTALERLSADISASEYMRPSRDTKQVLFDGSELSVTFARTSLGPNASPGLDVVRIAETTDAQGFVLTRSRVRFAPGAVGDLNFVDPVVLLRAPYRMTFSYAGRDRVWKDSWRDSESLPSAVLMTVRDAATERALGLSRIAVIHIDSSAESVCAQADGGCGPKNPAATDGAAPAAAAGASGR